MAGDLEYVYSTHLYHVSGSRGQHVTSSGQDLGWVVGLTLLLMRPCHWTCASCTSSLSDTRHCYLNDVTLVLTRFNISVTLAGPYLITLIQVDLYLITVTLFDLVLTTRRDANNTRKTPMELRITQNSPCKDTRMKGLTTHNASD